MKKLSPGWSDPNFTVQIVCRGTDWERNTIGCGATLEVSTPDMFTQFKHDIGGKRTEVRCFCCECGAEHTLDLKPDMFKVPLPDKKEWKEAHGL